jgi:hypothetical protein
MLTIKDLTSVFVVSVDPLLFQLISYRIDKVLLFVPLQLLVIVHR